MCARCIYFQRPDQRFEQSGIEKSREQIHISGSFSPLALFQVSAKLAWRLPSNFAKGEAERTAARVT
jgi:hypothetical protein